MKDLSDLGRVDEFEVFPTKSVGYRKTYFSLNASKNNWLLLIRQHALKYFSCESPSFASGSERKN